MADYDLIIAGGGPVGSALALALADGRRRIAVIEAREGLPPTGTRAIVLAAGSVRLLDALGVWESLAANAVPVSRVEVSQQGWPGRTRIDAGEEGVVALGRVVTYGALARRLAESARDAPGVDWMAPATVYGAADEVDHVRVDLRPGGGAGTDGDRSLTAALAVAAEGTDSPLRQALGIALRVHDYDQVALVMDLATRMPSSVAHERFTADGTLAVLPRAGAHATLVWATSTQQADTLAALARADLGERVDARLGSDLRPVRVESDPERYPLRRVEAERLRAGRGVVIGNAARTLHPVAAQGFNLALRDACTLAEHLLAAPDPGAGAVLAGWERDRRLDRWLTRDFTDLLARGFGHGPRLLAAPRAGALLGIDACPAARGLLAAQTMGLASGLPRIGTWRPETWR